MRSRTLVAAAVLGGLAALPAFAEDGYRHGRVRFVESGVTLQRATEVSAEEALANLPFLPGDRVWTDSAGRAEMQFPDGTIVRVDRRSKLDYAGHEEGQDERIVLRLWSGSALVRVRSRGFARFEIETPAGMVQALDRGIVRVDVEAGETRVSVYAGEAVLDDGRRQVRLASGERTWARWGAEAEEPRRFDPGEDDEFARWDGLRESEDRWAARSAEYLPDELDAYAGEFESNGAWQYEGTSGYVWVPRVEVGWQPYSNGHWTWTPYGWTWVPYERWGWAPSHYGRWGFSASFGWYWAPGRTWGPGWVSWAVGGGYVGWCPLGYRDRPIHPWGGHGRYGGDQGHAVPRGGRGHGSSWNVVRHGDLGGRDVARRRVGVDRIDPTALRVADSSAVRPTRDGRGLRESDTVARAISRRPTPGDFVRELGVDNRTTIPAPWTRGYGPPPAGVDGARYGAQRREEGRESRSGSAAAPWGGPTSGSGRAPESRAVSPRRAPRPAPGSTASRPTETAERPVEAGRTPSSGAERRRPGSIFGFPEREGSSERVTPSERTERAQPSHGTGARARGDGGSRAPRNDGESRYRPRPEGAGSSYEPRGGGESSGSSRPRSEGAASRTRPSGGGGEPRGSGGSSYSRPSGGGERRSSGGTSSRSSGVARRLAGCGRGGHNQREWRLRCRPRAS
jgi:hypothetical protein